MKSTGRKEQGTRSRGSTLARSAGCLRRRASGRLWVRGRKSHPEQIWSALPQIADIDFSRDDFSVGPQTVISIASSASKFFRATPLSEGLA